MESTTVQIFEGEHDDEGVFVYQAFCDNIADWAIKNQTLGGPDFNPKRMTWIKPSFAWVLYRSGYGNKHNQNRILKVKISHKSMASILTLCECKTAGGGSLGRVQWDPARDILSSDNGKEPRKMLRKRAIQIGVKGRISELYVSSILSIEDVTPLAHKVGKIHSVLTSHKLKNNPMIELLSQLPNERSYIPHCSSDTLKQLGLLPGKTADDVYGLGRGKVGK